MLPAAHGDCLWLEYGPPDARRVVIIDGGPGDTYRRALRPRIERFAAAAATGRRRGRPRIECLIVTHIDNDHIEGALDLVRDTTLGVDIGQVWFNGWDQIALRDQLGVKEAIALSKAITARKLPLNTPFAGRAVQVDPVDPGRAHKFVGGLTLTVLSPTEAELLDLRKNWEKVLAEAAVRDAARDKLGASTDVEQLAGKPFKSDAAPANGSSIALLAQYKNRRVLLAADSFAPVVERSLRRLGHTETKRLALDAYKISHHGSRGNNSAALLRLVTCTNYLFSTNGAKPSEHPHAECVARVLVHGAADGGTVTLHSNYRRGAGVLWNARGVVKMYKCEVREPAPREDGLAIDLE